MGPCVRRDDAECYAHARFKFQISRKHRARGFASTICPLENQRAQGKPGALSTRDRAHKMHTGDRKVRRNTRPSLRNGFTAYSALSPETNSSCLRR